MKRAPGPIETPPSVHNPPEGRSRSPEVTFQRGNQEEEEEGRELRSSEECNRLYGQAEHAHIFK